MTVNRRRRASSGTSTWLTRAQTSELLGNVAISTLQYWEAQGRLHPGYDTRDEPGRGLRTLIVYDPKEVTRLPRRRPRADLDTGELAARCFELLDEGKSVREIVIKLRKTPEEIEMLREQWDNGGGNALIIGPAAKKVLEAHLGPFKDVTEMVELLEQQLKKNPSRPRRSHRAA